MSQHNPEHHEVDSFLKIVNSITGMSAHPAFEFPLKKEDKIIGEEYLKEHGVLIEKPIVVIHPGCGNHGKKREWPQEYYSKLINTIESDVQVILTGGESERALVEHIASQITHKHLAFIGIPLIMLAGIISCADCFISGNTGIMHLAASLKIPCIALHGPTNPVQWGPYGEHHYIIQSQVIHLLQEIPVIPVILDLAYYVPFEIYSRFIKFPGQAWDHMEFFMWCYSSYGTE